MAKQTVEETLKKVTKKKVIIPRKKLKKPVGSIQAFRTDPELETLLSKVPNKSEFIKQALIKAFAMEYEVTCPLCKGKGKINYSRKSVKINRKRKSVKLKK